MFAAGIDLERGTNTPEVGVYQINTSTGALTEIFGSPLAVPNGNGSTTSAPTQLYMAPNNQYLYLTLASGGTDILSFTESTPSLGVPNSNNLVNLSTGGTSQNNVVANAASTLLFMTEIGTGVRVFTIGTGGALSEIKGSPFCGGHWRHRHCFECSWDKPVRDQQGQRGRSVVSRLLPQGRWARSRHSQEVLIPWEPCRTPSRLTNREVFLLWQIQGERLILAFTP